METGEAIREFVKSNPIYCKVGKVTKVADTTCEASLVEDENVTFTEVRLKAHLSGDKSIIIKPAVGSFVILGFLTSTDVYVAMYDEVEAVKIMIGGHVLALDNSGLSINVSNGKIEIKNDQENLKKLLQDLIAEIKLITVSTPMGNSGTPLNFLNFELIAKRVPLLLK